MKLNSYAIDAILLCKQDLMVQTTILINSTPNLGITLANEMRNIMPTSYLPMMTISCIDYY